MAVNLLLMTLLSALSPGQTTDRVSLDENGQEAQGSSVNAQISNDGRHVVFQSSAMLTVGSSVFTNVFVRDRNTGRTVILDTGPGGAPSNAASLNPRMSSDGRFVVFFSAASNLVAGDLNVTEDVFLYDRDVDDNGVFDEGNGAVELISLAYDGSQSDAPSDLPVVSDDGRWVVFWSAATNLVANDVNSVPDLFVRDRVLQMTSRLSVSSAGAEANGSSTKPALSASGRFLAFATHADNLVGGDTNGVEDVVLLDRDPDINGVFDEGNSVYVMVSNGDGGVPADGASGAPDVSDDGTLVVFDSVATNLVAGGTSGRQQVYLRDLNLGSTFLLSRNGTTEGNDRSEFAAISGGGAYAVFQSRASNLVSGDNNNWDDVFLVNLGAGSLKRYSVNGAGGESSSYSHRPAIAEIGPQVAFNSPSSDLVPHDTNNSLDVFVHGVGNFAPQLVVEELHRGQTSAAFACNCWPNETVVFMYSLSGLGSGPCPPHFGGSLCLDLLAPVTLLGTATTDAFGAASVSGSVPPSAALVPVYFQIAIRRGTGGVDSVKSNTVVQVIQP